MMKLQSDPELYHFVPQDPLTLAELETRYEKWQVRRSPFGNELWLNWIARKKSDQEVIGHFQAGVELNASATIAYTVGKNFQQQGFALESLELITSYLRREFQTASIKAWVDTRNAGSIALLKKLGFTQTLHLPNADFFKGQSSDEFVFEQK